MKDWCISRQLWWGQRIPAWYDDDGKFVVAESEQVALTKYEAQYGQKASRLKQDDDVLDTWFSSWLWPMEVFNGITDPGNKEINYYYPTSVLVTGQDIIFFWVARMIMAGMEYKNAIPFSDVYFTGMVRDKQGRKMSKSLGNSPDLLQMIDKFGADAVRFGIMISSPAGNDLLFDDTSPEQGRNFNNKIWNVLKLLKMWEEKLKPSSNGVSELSAQEGFIVMDVSGFSGTVELNEDVNTELRQPDFAVRWFRSRLAEARLQVQEMYKGFRLSEALKTIYTLVWDDFCSWYLEWVKPAPHQSIDPAIYDSTIEFFTELMHLLHPFMPFVTEEIYHLLADRTEDLCIRQYTPIEEPDHDVLSRGKVLKEVISGLRDSRNRAKLKLKDEIKLYIITSEQEMYMSFYHILTKQLNANSIAFNTDARGHNISVVIGKDKFFIETAAPIDNAEEKQELEKELKYLEGFLLSVDKKLTNERFMQSAKPEVIQLEQKKRSDAETKIRVIRESLSRL
jgi:valyl-tRNA synthetase